eukprot:8976642-Alexandrium_andersonii.AAC.1
MLGESRVRAGERRLVTSVAPTAVPVRWPRGSRRFARAHGDPGAEVPELEKVAQPSRSASNSRLGFWTSRWARKWAP